jgi:PAS domain S-box-containing protein
MSLPTGSELVAALEHGRIVPYFQPIVDLRDGTLTSFEVLARWTHPVRGPLPPEHFIQLAEEAGCIGELSESILKQAFQAAASILPRHITLAVNISPLQLRESSFPGELERIASAAGFPLNQIVLEVTESALLGNIAHARAIAHALKDLGVKLALDDFGTGYSSLRHLQSLPFDELKVDRSFVSDMGHTRESRKIAAAVIGLGQSMGLKTVAEGVEDRNQADMLLWLGCDQAQGWLYGHPVPAEALPEILRQRSLGDDSPSKIDIAASILPHLEAFPAQRLSQLQAIYDGVPVGLCFLDTKLRCLSVNRRMAAMFGVSVNDHLGRYLTEIYPGIAQAIAGYLHRALAGESLGGLEIEEIAPNGNRTLLLSCEPVLDEADEVVGVSVAVVDITERKLAEEARREAEDHYRHAVKLNPHMLWTMDANGMNDTNEMNVDPDSAWARLTGQHTSEMRGRGWMNALHPDDSPVTHAAIEHAIATGEPLNIDYRLKADGEWRWMRNRGWPRRDPQGRIVRWYGIVEDIDNATREQRRLSERIAEMEREIGDLRRRLAPCPPDDDNWARSAAGPD